MSAAKKRWLLSSLAVLLAVGGFAAWVWAKNAAGNDIGDAGQPPPAELSTRIERGAYLARAGNCAACHTARGGEAFAGGLAIPTPFGAIYTSNLTPDATTGIGNWSSTDFWRAMHHGKSKDGRLLYPAFPYTSYTQVSREDSDAIHAWLKTLPAVTQPNRQHEVRFPYNSQAALAVWRALYFSPGVYQPDAQRSAEWNRGAYLVQGLGHCAACHSPRNALGATRNGPDLAGGLIPVQNWYAPSLASTREAGVADWEPQDIVRLLKTGVSEHASVTGPMAEVVRRSTQHLSDADLLAMARFLKELPPGHQSAEPAEEIPLMAGRAVVAPATAAGAKLYTQHCAACHGENGKGVPNAYPALAGNRAVTMAQTANLVQIVLNGGYAPATEGNPRPYGMPPFVLLLSDNDTSALLTYIRQAWGNQAASVTPLEINRIRAGVGSER
jgi:mono/diheme cytochrome c family protein